MIHRTPSKYRESKKEEVDDDSLTIERRKRKNILNQKQNKPKEETKKKDDFDLIERRNIINQQEKDYIETLERNRELLRVKEENELLEVIKMSEISNIYDNKKKAISSIFGNDINIKFTFPSGVSFQQGFNNLVKLSQLYTYIDLYLHYNNLNYIYELICYPNKVLINNNELLSDMNLPKQLKISIYNKEE
jgi:hypothetical protein